MEHGLLQVAVQSGDLPKALRLLASLRSRGGVPQLWMYDMLINLHSRKRDMPSAFAVRDLMQQQGLEPSQCDIPGPPALPYGASASSHADASN